MTYFISPDKKTDWHVTTEQLAHHLQVKWKNVRLQFITNEQRNFSLEWEIDMMNYNLNGMLNKNGMSIYIESESTEVCATFAIWFRTIVPSNQTLLFYDELYTKHLELTSTTRESDINQLFK